MRSSLLLFAILLSQLMSGCARDSSDIYLGGIDIVTANEIEIILRYDAIQQFAGIVNDVETKAQEHCKQFEKRARFHEKEIRWAGAVVVIYRCE